MLAKSGLDSGEPAHEKRGPLLRLALVVVVTRGVVRTGSGSISAWLIRAALPI
jgi:hypothetical protein